MVTSQDIDKAAADLIDAETQRRQIGLLSQRHPDMDMSGAYAVQSALLRAKLASGRSIIGWKIGLTSRAMQEALGITTPDSGILFDDMAFPNGGTVPKARFIQPRVEAEIAFLTRAEIPADVDRDGVLAATEAVAPALEILDTRIQRADPITGARRTFIDTISDNAANAGIVLGAERHDPKAFDLRYVGAIVRRDGIVEETGLGAGVLDDPVESVIWLARRMAQYGQKIEAGQIILSGSFIRPIECPPGSKIQAEFGAFGSVAIRFD